MSLVRMLQEESTIVCFRTLLWQVAGEGSSGTWGTRQEYTQVDPEESTRKGSKRPSPQACPHHRPRHPPPTVRTATPTYFLGVGTPWAHFPGIPEVHGVFLHLEATAGEVVVLDAVKVPTQATHLLLGDQLGA